MTDFTHPAQAPLAIIGAGTMGHGIAYVAVLAGFPTRLYDPFPAALAKGRAAVEKLVAKAVERGKLSSDDGAKALSLLATPATLAEAATGVAAVIEAAPEKIDLKKSLFSDLSGLVGPDTLLGTNTSSMSVTEIAAAATGSPTGPERVIGLHFFNPPYALKLLEIVRAEQTSPATLERAQALGQALGREMIVVTDAPGFATSRLGVALRMEAIRMVEQGVASPEDIDRGMVAGYGHPVGPLRLADQIGLDVGLAIAEYLHRELGGEQFRPPTLLRRMVRAGKLGRKTGQGFYNWSGS